MTPLEWKSLSYFKPNGIDNWLEPTVMQYSLLHPLDRLRHYLDTPIIVTSGYREGDRKMHGLGLAVDVVFPNCKLHILDLFLSASRFGFTGIGVYRDWSYDGKKVGGLHLDKRNARMKAIWLCIKNGNFQVYKPLTFNNLSKYGMI